jgi:HPt (histidine-containing phosphotransfer) domain-containing protein
MLDEARRAELADELGDDFLDELTATFWTDAWALLDHGIACIVNDDIVELRKILHTLTGSAGNLGLSGITEAAADAKAAMSAGERPDFGRLQAVMLRTVAVLEVSKTKCTTNGLAISA